MIQDMKLAGLVDGTQREYLRAVRQLTAHYRIAPNRITDGLFEGREPKNG